jgi:hypothetical protein
MNVLLDNCNFPNTKMRKLLETISFDGVMEDVGKCYVTALKNGSSIIEMKNIRNKPNHINYVFYTDILLFAANDFNEHYNAWEFRLKKENNFCHKCKQYNMKFVFVGVYD